MGAGRLRAAAGSWVLLSLQPQSAAPGKAGQSGWRSPKQTRTGDWWGGMVVVVVVVVCRATGKASKIIQTMKFCYWM